MIAPINSAVRYCLILLTVAAGCGKTPPPPVPIRQPTAADVIGSWRCSPYMDPSIVDIVFSADGSFVQTIKLAGTIQRQQSGRWWLAGKHLNLDELLKVDGANWRSGPAQWEFITNPQDLTKLLIVGGPDSDPDSYDVLVKVNSAPTPAATKPN